ncbi:MAG: hypothetical protein ABJQ70_14870 [Roseobacter sp.]
MAFYLGGFNAVIARVAGTCTQGDADHLFGAALSAVLYCIALLALRFTPHKRIIFLSTLPLWPLWLWQTVFTLQLNSALLFQEQAACSFLQNAPFPKSGDEVLYSFVWSVMTLILTLGTIYMWRNPKQPPASSPPQSR